MDIFFTIVTNSMLRKQLDTTRFMAKTSSIKVINLMRKVWINGVVFTIRVVKETFSSAMYGEGVGGRKVASKSSSEE